MGITCSCQTKIDDDYILDDAPLNEANQQQHTDLLQNADKIEGKEQEQQKEQQTIDIDPIQLKSYEIEDNCPQGLQPLSFQAQQEFIDQYPAIVKKQLQKLPRLEIKATLTPNYKRIPLIDTPYQLLNGDVYVGQWAEGKPFGLGKIYYLDHQVYEGQVVDGVPDGEGRKIFKDGSFYTGQFKMGEINGKGKFTRQDGFKYEGDFLCGRPDGNGIETWPDGTNYQGQYKLGKKNGKGTFTWSNRKNKKTGKLETYTGFFKNDVFHGQGRYEWLDDRIYDGEWVEGRMEGKGEFIWPDKRKYTGHYLKDIKSGYGELEWPDGKKLSGQWRMGKLTGIVTLTIKGKIKEGQTEPEPDKIFLSEWEDGRRIKWLDNQKPSGIHSNISQLRNFDEHQQNTSQIIKSQIRQDDIQSNNKDQLLNNSEIQQQNTVFQQNEQIKQIQQQQQQQQQQQHQIIENQNNISIKQNQQDNVSSNIEDNQFYQFNDNKQQNEKQSALVKNFDQQQQEVQKEKTDI
ncbi:unnamed protein product [Paramecium pentaurelia]|uniref:MORN repeat protein n=1 Tax=Paramecium pentaurelia TaxID=43138 RepID=A0A8S1VVY3_9CILI|nr:unnamed protein product [Paramecium pentaurelia]